MANGTGEGCAGPGLGGGGLGTHGTPARCRVSQVEWGPPRRHVCTPHSWECELIQKWGLCRSDQVTGLQLGPKSSDRCPQTGKERGIRNVGTHRGEGGVGVEAETGVILLRARKHQGLLGTARNARGLDGFPSGPPDGTPPPPTPGLRPSAFGWPTSGLRNCAESTFLWS